MYTLDICNTYHQDPVRFFDFARFKNGAGDYYLIEGLPSFPALKSQIGKRLVYLNFEEPNCFYSPGFLSCHLIEDYIEKIFTLCPYTAEWMNRKQANNKRIPIYFPFNESHVPAQIIKDVDLIYIGSIPPGQFVGNLIHIISKYNYIYAYYDKKPMVTHVNPGYLEKLQLIARSKISIVHNLLFPTPSALFHARSMYPDILDNEAYSLETLVCSEPIMPQLKSRVFEAAFCRSLILCRRDPWNVIERYFEPEKEFIYYSSDNLDSTIREIISNYSDYHEVIERAHQKAMDCYTTARFFQQFLREL